MSSDDDTKKDGATTTELEWPMNRVRQTFIHYFVEKHDHVYWKSSPCVPHDDPTLLFANAGMNQFKSKFLGTADPALKDFFALKRAVNSQKCIRAGGKHNDLDDVGKDVYHHTFFEMLGNWSFGDYFKEGAIDMAWKCLVDEFGLNPERLYATYFGGDESTPCDDEAREIWLKYLPAERVLPFDAKDNFWEMGPTGPCGPCTEIHYDRIGNRDASLLVNADLPDVIEIWNNVFIQYNRELDGSLRNLPQQHIDTGMGLERLVSILQGVDSNYDTDVFIPIFDEITKITGAKPYSGKVGKDDVGYRDMAYRVVADHIRTLSFAIADGAIPSNDGRGYVLRRVLRRAVRYGRQNLGAELGFFCTLVPKVVELMSTTFPELKEKQDFITSIIKEEEESFGRTLDKGLMKFKEMASKSSSNGKFSGADAHFLYTSLGFPPDLTELMAEEVGLTLDKEGFERHMQHEKDLSAAAEQEKKSGGSGKDMRLVAEQTSHLVSTKLVEPTKDDDKYIWNVDLEGCKAKALFIGRNETEDKIGFVSTISSQDGMVGMVLDKTSFYAEAGGQIYDTGTIVKEDGTTATMSIENVQLYGQFVLHIGHVTEGTFSEGDLLTCKVNYERRSPIASNHTMTHLLNYALKNVLVTQVQENSSTTTTVDQKGSLVDEYKLRFDFSWNAPLTEEQLRNVERMVQEKIQSEIPIQSQIAPLEQAQSIVSLRAVFGETYPDPVRVVSVSTTTIDDILSNPQDTAWNEYSIEFCGGTHLKNTSEAHGFVLLSEEGLAKGIRRITAVTQDDAKKAIELGTSLSERVEHAQTLEGGDELEQQVKQLTNQVNDGTISASLKISLRNKLKECGKKVVTYKKEKALAQKGLIVEQVLAKASETTDTKVVVRYDFGLDGKIAGAVKTAFTKQVKDKALMLISGDEDSDRIMVVAVAPKKGDIDCKEWIATVTEGMGGKGGGKKESAQCTVPGMKEHIETIMEKAQKQE